MERVMSVEDKIRRAEEIYSRRRENNYKSTTARVSVESGNDKTNRNLNIRLKKMIIQISICLLIYLIFYYIINNNYIFSEDFKNKCQEILSYDISFSEMYKKCSELIVTLQTYYEESILNFNKEDLNETDIESDGTEQEQNQENNQEENQENNKTEELDVGIGGAEEQTENLEETGETESLSEEEQMQKDAEDIKSKISFIKPLEGTITSYFGWRDPTVSTVSKYHTGIDIAANQGTDIISATTGEVILASSEGAYGNHLKIQIEDVIIIYAHCLELNVKEGDEISQGQKIATVGSTGNSTGPHLHFEIRKEDRYVDPKLILDF